jgi:putative ABC transport system ATP-binding protein
MAEPTADKVIDKMKHFEELVAAAQGEHA